MKKQMLVLISLLVISLYILGSCSFQKSSVNERETNKVDSVISYYADSLAVDPLKVISVLRDWQGNVSDSINYYSLQQTISRCYYFDNRIDSAFLLNDRILEFLKRQPEKTDRWWKLSAERHITGEAFSFWI